MGIYSLLYIPLPVYIKKTACNQSIRSNNTRPAAALLGGVLALEI
jgi:hypothetical protein